MPYDATDLSPVTEKTIAKIRAKENLARLRDFIGSLPPEGFDMNTWNSPTLAMAKRVNAAPVHRCGSVGCIGGWGELLFGAWSGAWSGAVPELGLSERQANALFYPYALGDRNWDKITQKQAMAAIDNVIACGWPKWKKAIKVK